MSPKELMRSDKSKFVMSLIWALAATLVLVVKEVTVPRMADGRTMVQAISNHDYRLDKIERLLEKMTDGDKTGILVEGQKTLAETVKRIEDKLDGHIQLELKQR